MRFEVKDTCLEHIFECGQCFRWDRKADGSYTGIAGSRPANIRFEAAPEEAPFCGGEKGLSGILTVTVPEESEEEADFWRGYLDLDRDYGEIKKELIKRDPSGVMEKTIAYGGGIRILRQDPWEMTVSFIISQNNNIPRIKKNIRGLSEAFGEPAGEFEGEEWYAVPTAEKLASLEAEDLAEIKLGYRARYLIETARCVAASGMDVIYEDPGCLCGVGPKVENCIRLFGLQQLDSFPIDVWVKKVMSELYGLETPGKMAAFAEETFGEYGGIAQQYLFYYMRENSGKK